MHSSELIDESRVEVEVWGGEWSHIRVQVGWVTKETSEPRSECTFWIPLAKGQHGLWEAPGLLSILFGTLCFSERQAVSGELSELI